MKTPSEIISSATNSGCKKANRSFRALLLQSMFAGAYVAMAAQFSQKAAFSVGEPWSTLVFALCFPVGLLAIIVTDAELFTGDVFLLTCSTLARETTVLQLVRNWTVAWIGNFLGVMLWILLFVSVPDALPHAFVVAMGEHKIDEHLIDTFLKGIAANWLVCLAVFQTYSSTHFIGKVYAMWTPVVTFAVAGFQHCVANMYLLTIALMYGAEITLTDYLLGLLVATIGNVVGGGIFMGLGQYVLVKNRTTISFGMNSTTYI